MSLPNIFFFLLLLLPHYFLLRYFIALTVGCRLYIAIETQKISEPVQNINMTPFMCASPLSLFSSLSVSLAKHSSWKVCHLKYQCFLLSLSLSEALAVRALIVIVQIITSLRASKAVCLDFSSKARADTCRGTSLNIDVTPL